MPAKKKRAVGSSQPKEEWTDFEAYDRSPEEFSCMSDSDDLRKLAALDFMKDTDERYDPHTDISHMSSQPGYFSLKSTPDHNIGKPVYSPEKPKALEVEQLPLPVRKTSEIPSSASELCSPVPLE